MKYPRSFLMRKIREALAENRMLRNPADPYRSSFGRKEDKQEEEEDDDVRKYKEEVSGK